MGVQEPFSSLTSCPADISVNLTIMLLIILGGAGFLTWNDVLQQKRHIRKLRLQTKIILASTALLILLPFLYFFFFEFRSFSGTERLMLSLFQSVTPRTAGFNTFDYGKMSESGWLITILLMMIGGAPGSTAGGMKVTTMAVLFVSAKAYLRRKHEVDCFRRRIDTDVIHNAIALLTLYMGLLLAGTMIVANIEGLPVMVSMFECASALGTVGLTTGITTSLSAVSRILLICFMFFGRIGGLTLGYALASTVRKNTGRLPVENVSVG
jgi:trk system potassium uptake protein TrkH